MKTFTLGVLWLLVVAGAPGTGFADDAPVAKGTSAERALIERGRYLARVSGCNDCHTPGWAVKEGQVPEALWLTGDSFGWRGPWGTTYATNLRLLASTLTEAQWIETARTLRRRPPMPWFNLNAMHEDDLRALYHFMRATNDPGAPAPAALPPGVEPPTPYAMWVDSAQPVAQQTASRR